MGRPSRPVGSRPERGAGERDDNQNIMNRIIGDLDSADPAVLQKFRTEGVEIELHPRDKNETDLELTIHRAVERNPNQIIIVAALGGRLDQTLANITLLTDSGQAFDIRLDDGVE